jgi:hypothetical protein
MGISWSEENFWSAIRRGDDRATRLFIKGGMSPSASELHRVLSDPGVGNSVWSLSELISQAFHSNEEFCLAADQDGPPGVSAHRAIGRFGEYAKRPAVAEFVREYCKSRNTKAVLENKLVDETKRLSSQRQKQAEEQKQRDSCVFRFDTAAYERWWRELFSNAAIWSCTGQRFKDDLEKALCQQRMPLKKGLGAGDMITLGFDAYDFSAGAREFCRTRFPVRRIDTSLHDGLKSAIGMFEASR